jgi:hypothetical protein
MKTVAAFLLVALFAACSGTTPSEAPTVPSASPVPSQEHASLGVSNGTTIPVTLILNGVVVRTIEAGGYEDPVTATLPPLPWLVETRSPSGRVLSQMTVNPGDVVYQTPDANGRSAAKGDAVRVDLPCGRLDVWAGPPLLAPVFSPDPSLSCD